MKELPRAEIIKSVRCWVEQVVMGLNLCPFAGEPMVTDRVRFVVSEADSAQQLLGDLQKELNRLEIDTTVETTLLIHPQVLQNFFDYNQFLDQAEALLVNRGLEGIYQLASFHPDYQFAGTEPGDAQNYTNRAPYPLLHLLREASLERAIANHPDVAQIPERNIELLERMGPEALRALLLKYTGLE